MFGEQCAPHYNFKKQHLQQKQFIIRQIQKLSRPDLNLASVWSLRFLFSAFHS